MATIIPIVKLKAILDGMIEYIRRDYEAKIALNNEDDTFLYKVLYGNSSDGYDFFTEGKNIFLRTSTSPRKITTRIMFAKDIAPTPTIHVREPSAVKGVYNSIGGLINEKTVYNDQLSYQYRDTKRSVFEFVITSDNPLDTILISEVIYSIMLATFETFGTQLFDTFDFQMKELIAKNELIPYPLFIKSIEIVAQYENTVTGIDQIDSTELCDSINFQVGQIFNEK